MAFAWYRHLKHRSEALSKVILASWGMAFFAYCFQVPANRIGSYGLNAAQLKTIPAVMALTVFAVFSVADLGEKLKWNYAEGAACRGPRRFLGLSEVLSLFVRIYPRHPFLNRIGSQRTGQEFAVGFRVGT